MQVKALVVLFAQVFACLFGWSHTTVKRQTSNPCTGFQGNLVSPTSATPNIFPMATTNGSSTPDPLFPSHDNDPSNPPDILQSNDGVDRASHREANGAGKSSESYSSMGVDGSAVPREPPSGQLDSTLAITPFAYQTTASESSRPAADDDAKRAMRSHLESVGPRRYFNPLLPSQHRGPALLGILYDYSEAYAGPRPQSSDDESSGYGYCHFPVTPSPSRRGVVIPDPMKSSPSMQPSRQPWVGTNSLASSMQRVTNVSASAEPPQRQEQVRMGLLRNADSNRSESHNVNPLSGAQMSTGHQAHLPKDPTGERATYRTNVDLLLRANSNKSESQNGDLPSVLHLPSEQQVHLSSPSKDRPASGQSFAASVPGVTKTSRRMQDTAPGEPQAPYVGTPPEVSVYPNESGESAPRDMKGGRDLLNRQQVPNDTLGVTNTQLSGLTQDMAPGKSQAPLERTPHEVPACLNASRECAPPDQKGGHDPLNRKRAPNDVSSPLVRHLPATEPPPRCQSSPKPPSITTRPYYVPYLQAADHSMTSPFPTAELRSPVSPIWRAAVQPLNLPSLLRLDGTDSEHNHGTWESPDESDPVNSEKVIGEVAVAETSLAPPPALLRPNCSLVVSSLDEGRSLSPIQAGVERRQSSRHSESGSSDANRIPRIDGMCIQGFAALYSH